MHYKKNIIIFTFVAIVVIVAVLLYYRGYMPKREKGPSAEEILEQQRQLIKKVTAPVSKEVTAPKEVTGKLTAPKKSAPVSTGILDKLTAPAPK